MVFGTSELVFLTRLISRAHKRTGQQTILAYFVATLERVREMQAIVKAVVTDRTDVS